MLEITGQDRLLDETPALQSRLEHRNPWIDPLSHLQVELLRRLRAGREEARAPLLATITGIAAGMRNTGLDACPIEVSGARCHLLTAMRAFVAAVLAVLLLAVPASAAPRLRVSAPSSAKAGTKVTVKLTGPKTGKVRVYVLTRTSVRKADKPLARGNLKRGKVTLHVKVPAKARTYRLVACLEGSKLKCATAKKLKAVAVAGGGQAAVVVTPPGATPSAPVVELPGRPAANPWSDHTGA